MSQVRDPLGHLSDIIEERVAEWNLRREKGLDQDYRPLVTISREFFSGGVIIAEKVAEKLNMAFWNKELVQAVTKNTGLQESIIDSLDHKAKSTLDDMTDAIIFGQNATNRGYAQQLCRVFRTIEEHGSAVLMGRGAQFVLKKRALKVRILCAFGKRAENFAKKEQVSLEEAKTSIKKMDEERKAYFQENYKANLSDPHNYDLCLNVTDIDLDSASDWIVSCYKAKFGLK